MKFFVDIQETTDRYGEKHRKMTIKPFRVALVVIALLLLFNSFKIIPTGYTGVRVTFGQVNDTVCTNGFNWKIPIVQRIAKVNNKQQDDAFATKSSIWGETSEKVPVYMADVTISYKINPEKSAWIYANVSDYRSNLINDSIVASSLKNASVQFTAEQVTVRSNIEAKSMESLQHALDSKYGVGTVMILKVVINNMDFEQSYNDAINQRSLAQKTQETQKISNETAIAKAEADAKVKLTQVQAESDAKVIAAQGEADALKIESEARAAANEVINESITGTLIDYNTVDKWNGELPKVTGSNSIIDIGVD